MTTQFPPSTFPTMSLGHPANLVSTSETGQAPLPPPADPGSVAAAVRGCSSPDASIRRPAEVQLKQWEDASGRGVVGYLTSLMTLIDINDATAGSADENCRLLAAILLKNGIPKSFSAPLPDAPAAEVDGSDAIFGRLREERAGVRARLPLLLFREGNGAVALHLRLALGNVAPFEFPTRWPTLLEDLAGLASASDAAGAMARGSNFDGSVGPGALSLEDVVRTRAVKALRLCLASIKHRRVVVQGAGTAAKGTMLHMGSLGSILRQARQERKETHDRACTIFESLAEGAAGNARAAIEGDGVAGGAFFPSAWRGRCLLAVGFIKCLTELWAMVEIENAAEDPRAPVVRAAAESLAQICEATRAYPGPLPPAIQAAAPEIREEYVTFHDKVHRAGLVCFVRAVSSLPSLVASQIPRILPLVADPVLTADATALRSAPPKRLGAMTAVMRVALRTPLYDEREATPSKNAVLAALLGGGDVGEAGGADAAGDPGVVAARTTVAALLAEGTVERLVEAVVGKLLRLGPAELEEWEDDPEGRYETDLAERSDPDEEAGDDARRCGGHLLRALLARETDRVARALLELTQRACRRLPPDDAEGMLDREACYRALELCRPAMVGGGQRRLNFSDWFQAELRPMLQAELGEGSPVAARAMQARAVQVVHAYAASLRPDEFGAAFFAAARLVAAPDLVTALCAARCVAALALLHVRGAEESVQLAAVRERSVLALGNAFALANRCESEECLRVTLMCVSSLVEANGLYLEPVLQAIAEQLPPLWARARDSVPIHSCLLSVLTHLIMKMGYESVEHADVQKVLFPLLDYCTDISAINRADTLLEDGLRLWLVTVVSSRMATMGAQLANMLPRLEAIVRSGLEPHLSLKVMQYNAVLLGPRVIQPLAPVLSEMLVNLTCCIHSEKKEEDDESMEDKDQRSNGTDRGVATLRDAVAALSFADAIMQLFPDLGLSICAPAILRVAKALPGKPAGMSPLYVATFQSLGRMIWISPDSLEEIFADGPDQEQKIAFVVNLWISSVTDVSVMVMLSSHAQKVAFIDQKGAALSLCSAVCRSSRVARAAGNDVVNFAKKLLDVQSSKLDLDALVEAVCSTTRRVTGDGPLGDCVARTAEILKSE
ncbi:hypothetical protein ACHAWF_012552 [Thalassiosira exigua]